MPEPKRPVQSDGTGLQIVFVRQQFSPFGGGERILDRMIAALLGRGVRVKLLGRAWEPRKNLEFIRCDPPRAPRFMRERRFADAACEMLRHETGSLVQSHDRVPCCDIFRAGEGSHAAYIEHRKRGLSRAAGYLLDLHPFHRSVIALEREMLSSPRLQAVIVNSTMVADEIHRLYSLPRERLKLVPNGIDLDRFRPEARERFRAETRMAMKTDLSRPVLLLTGSGFKRKGLGTAIEALAQSGTGAELWVIGSDRHSSFYERLAARKGISGRLRVIGPVADPLPYFAAADALILPSVYDPFPSAVIEALACGIPAITSTSCGARDVAAGLDAALVRDCRDENGFAEAIRKALDLASRPGTAEAARKIASGYSFDCMIAKMLDLYEKIAAQRDGRT